MSFVKSFFVAASMAPTLALATVSTTNPTFDFYKSGGSLIDGVSNSPSFVAGNIGLTVTARKSNGSAAQVADRWDGLGVVSGGFLEASEITAGESLVLTFNKAVNLTGLEFSMWEGLFDDATLSVGSKTIDLGNMNGSGLIVSQFSFNNLSGTQFIIKGEGLLTSFRLAGVSVTAAIPEPGTWALMALGLAGIGLASARRRR